MIRLENKDLEESVLSGDSCIAVPLEVFQGTDGKIEITTYSFCKELAGEFLSKFGTDIFSPDSLIWVNEKFGAIMDKLGYEHYSHEGELMLEYILTSSDKLYGGCEQVTRMIDDNSVLSELCRNTGCDIELNDDGEDVIFIVEKDGKILSYAGMNDVVYSDRSVEISVETDEEHRRRGLGSACVTALSKHILDNGRNVRYKCSAFNRPSYLLAEKCGFKLEGKRYSYICGIKE